MRASKLTSLSTSVRVSPSPNPLHTVFVFTAMSLASFCSESGDSWWLVGRFGANNEQPHRAPPGKHQIPGILRRGRRQITNAADSEFRESKANNSEVGNHCGLV
jgi:hypothetical protein